MTVKQKRQVADVIEKQGIYRVDKNCCIHKWGYGDYSVREFDGERWQTVTTATRLEDLFFLFD